MLYPTPLELLAGGDVGPFGIFALTVYEDGLAGQIDRVAHLPLYRPGVTVKIVTGDTEEGRLLLRASLARAREYEHYHALVDASKVLDENPSDKVALSDFITALAWILYLGKLRDASETLMEPGKQKSLVAAMKTTGLETANILAFVDILTSGPNVSASPKELVALFRKAKL